jgi:hypothetical protein
METTMAGMIVNIKVDNDTPERFELAVKTLEAAGVVVRKKMTNVGVVSGTLDAEILDAVRGLAAVTWVQTSGPADGVIPRGN